LTGRPDLSSETEEHRSFHRSAVASFEFGDTGAYRAPAGAAILSLAAKIFAAKGRANTDGSPTLWLRFTDMLGSSGCALDLIPSRTEQKTPQPRPDKSLSQLDQKVPAD